MNDNYHLQNDWITQIPEQQWQIYQQVLTLLNELGVPYAIGGAFSLAAYTGHWRNTKDLDVYVLPSDRMKVISAIQSLGLSDYYDVESYDRAWIFRFHQDEVIVDVIWAMANGIDQVDEVWLEEGVQVSGRGEILQMIPVEELIWGKIYVLQRERTDWPDILNLIHAAGPEIKWERLLSRLEEDTPLLAALLTVFKWLDPARAAELQPALWETVGVPAPAPEAAAVERRAARIDSRPWFYPLF